MGGKDGCQGRQEAATVTKIFVLIRSGKLYFYQRKVREFRKLLTVANMPGLTR